MNSVNGQPAAYKFDGAKQLKIYSSLKRFVGDGPSSFYRDACKVVSGGCDLETKTHLVGHLMREIFCWVIEIMLPIDYVNPSGTDNYKQKIRDAAKAYGLVESDSLVQFWLQRVAGNDSGLQSWAHRESMQSVRPISKEFEELWDGTERLLLLLVDKIESNYHVYTKQIDQILAKNPIPVADIEGLKKHIPLNQITLSYFFDRLERPECLLILEKNGFFKYPQKPLEHENGGISFPTWSPMTYLVRMSRIKSVQSDILRICLGIESENINTQVQILEIALNLPAEKSIEIVDKCYGWFNQMNSWFQPEKYGQLIVHLAEGGHKTEALELARKVLAIVPNPKDPTIVDGLTFGHDPVALFNDWHYEKILKESYPKFTNLAGIDAIKILLDLIGEYIKLSDIGRSEGSKDDYSKQWRPAIEDNSQNYDHGVKDLLVSGARDTCEQFLKSNPNEVMTVVTELESRCLTILDRLALHLLRLFPEKNEVEIIERLMDETEFEDNSRLTHEYFLLAETQAELLNKEQRNQIWSWIMAGADVEQFKKWRLQNGIKFSDEDGKKYERSWQMYHLMPFCNIDSKWQEYYNDLVKEFGVPKYPTFTSWSEGGSIGSDSGISAEQLKKMKTDEVVDFLKNWEPPESDLLDHSRDGTGRQLAEEIASEPEKWDEEAKSFLSLDPTYVRSYIAGFREAVKQGKKFNWKPVLDICQLVIEKPNKIVRKKASIPFGDDPDWSWSRDTIVDLLLEGLSDQPGGLTIELRDQVWKIIYKLTSDNDPTPEREKEYLSQSKDDPLTLAINTIRGDAMSAAIKYGAWLKNFGKEEERKLWNLKSNAPELLEVLNNHLSISKDPSLAIRAVYGANIGMLAWLDKKWLEDNQYLIFPKEPSHQPYFDASWETFIIFAHTNKGIFEIIKPQYERAVKELGKHSDTKHYMESPDQRLGHHLIVLYWNGFVNAKEGLLNDFYSVAGVELRSENLNFIGRVLKDEEKTSPEVAERLVSLLEDRIEIAKSSGGDIQEFENISWWLASDKFDEGWVLTKLLEVLEMGCDIEGDFLVMEKFLNIADKFPLKVIKCLRLMVENDKKEWGSLFINDEMKNILQIVLATKNEEAVEETKEFINRLESRNHMEFRDLLS